MTKTKIAFMGAEIGSAIAAVAGAILMIVGNFDSETALWGLLLIGAGIAGYVATRFVRRESGIRYRR